MRNRDLLIGLFDQAYTVLERWAEGKESDPDTLKVVVTTPRKALQEAAKIPKENQDYLLRDLRALRQEKEGQLLAQLASSPVGSLLAKLSFAIQEIHYLWKSDLDTCPCELKHQLGLPLDYGKPTLWLVQELRSHDVETDTYLCTTCERTWVYDRSPHITPHWYEQKEI
ncbi:MAG TPA: hypothetical protein DCE41_28310 [Cytophagales bacterium]|nr:hypothetical protein [Cytophagales bacterium]HAA18425.1 hypothetical protein [Cytophagales bacterium]HAP61471.1 hypothetical protein [Cytophagales bacterium]